MILNLLVNSETGQHIVEVDDLSPTEIKAYIELIKEYGFENNYRFKDAYYSIDDQCFYISVESYEE
jgi:hypothetical protein